MVAACVARRSQLLNKRMLMRDIESINWPDIPKEIVKTQSWDYRDAVEYFQSFIACQPVEMEDLSYMMPTLTDRALVSLTPKILQYCLMNPNSGVAPSLASILESRFLAEEGRGILSQEIKSLYQNFITYISELDDE